MEKLYKLRQWLNKFEASNYLTSALQEAVSGAAVLRLAMDGHLRLSVNLVNSARANIGIPIPASEAELYIWPITPDPFAPLKYDWLEHFTGPPPVASRSAQDKWLEMNKAQSNRLRVHCRGEVLSKDTVVQFNTDEVVSIDGVWDLTMLCAERLDVERAYYSDSYIEYTMMTLDGVLIASEDGTRYARVLERFSDDLKKHPHWTAIKF